MRFSVQYQNSIILLVYVVHLKQTFSVANLIRLLIIVNIITKETATQKTTQYRYMYAVNKNNRLSI